jgi:hypothetical protein
MRLRLITVFTCVSWLAASVVSATPITYELIPVNGAQGSTLTGSVTTDGTLGSVLLADILDWSFTSTGALAFSIDKSSPGSSTTCLAALTGCFTATPASLSFDFGSPSIFGPSATFKLGNTMVNFFDSPEAVSQGFPNFGQGNIDWFNGALDFRLEGAQPSVVAATPVPEPASGALFFVGLLFRTALIRRRRAASNSGRACRSHDVLMPDR